MFYLYHKAAYDPLLEVFKKDPKFDVAISLTHDVKRSFRLIDRQQSRIFLQKFENEGYQITDENEQFDIVIAPDVVEESRYGRTLLCLIYHGIIFTKTVTFRELNKHRNQRYMIFAEGEYSERKLVESGHTGASEIFKTGYPKMDPYFKEGQFDREQILISLGLDPAKNTVVFAPTYKPTCIYEIKDTIFEATKEYNLIIKLHHYAWSGKFARHSQHRIFERQIAKYPNAVLIPQSNYNILPLLYVADTLLSEASGAITEFLATGKIGIIYNLNHNRLKHSDGENLLTLNNREYLKESFVHIDNPDELESGIYEAINPDLARLEAARRDRDRFFYKLDGLAAERTKIEIERLFSEGTHFNPIK